MGVGRSDLREVSEVNSAERQLAATHISSPPPKVLYILYLPWISIFQILFIVWNNNISEYI